MIGWKFSCAVTLVLAAPLCFSQSNRFSSYTDSHGPEILAAGSTPSTKPLTERWLDLKTLNYSARYRNTVNDDGRRLFEFGQERYIADGRFKFDATGNYSVNFHGSSGRYFNWSYADLIGGQYKDSVVAARAYKTPAEKAALAYALLYDPNAATYKAGLPSRGGYFYLRQLFFSATPVPQFTAEFGSLFIEHGENTEITSFDDDGYISGERVRFHDSKHLFFDQLAATSAEMNSPLTPNFFARGADLRRANYTQYLAEKKFAGNCAASADYTMLNHTHTMREGLECKIPGGRYIDNARFEAYQRPDTVLLAGKSFASGNGLAVSAHQTFVKKVGFEGGYAEVDERYAIYSGSIYLASVGFAWNGDNYETGKRGFAKTDIKLANGVSLIGFYTHAIVPVTISHNEQGFTSGMQFDLKAIVDRDKNIF